MIEMFVVVAVLSALITAAMPNFTEIVKNTRIRSQVNDFHLSLLLARNEAISRISTVSVCRSDTSSGTVAGLNCSVNGICSCSIGDDDDDWEQGWIVFTDYDGDGEVDLGATPPEQVLQIREALDGGNTLRGNSGESVASYITFVGNGQLTGTSKTIELCDDRGADSGRAISINATGRPRVIDATDCML